MKILYGIIDKNIDVTNICLTKLIKNNVITIPANDIVRDKIFTDPLYGTLKKIFICKNNDISTYDHTVSIEINIITNNITTFSESKLTNIYSKLTIKHGTFNEKILKQKILSRYLTGTEKVLEIGSNNCVISLIIASILYNNTNFVTLEHDSHNAEQLLENKDLNNLNFHVENSTLSTLSIQHTETTRYVQHLIPEGWITTASDEILPGYKPVKTITFDELKLKYNINFDTLVLDCEGAFYYILMDMPEILDNINMIIMENDYTEINKKIYINNILKNNNFEVIYSEYGGWGPCFDCFFEVWKKQ